MGLFSVFRRGKNDDALQEMKSYLSRFMAEYAAENPGDMPMVAGIFANAMMMLNI